MNSYNDGTVFASRTLENGKRLQLISTGSYGIPFILRTISENDTVNDIRILQDGDNYVKIYNKYAESK